MADQRFDYELLLRIEAAERTVSSLANRIESEIGGAIKKAFSGSGDFDHAINNIEVMKKAANDLWDIQKRASEFTISQEQSRHQQWMRNHQAEMQAEEAAYLERVRVARTQIMQEQEAHAEKQKMYERVFKPVMDSQDAQAPAELKLAIEAANTLSRVRKEADDFTKQQEQERHQQWMRNNAIEREADEQAALERLRASQQQILQDQRVHEAKQKALEKTFGGAKPDSTGLIFSEQTTQENATIIADYEKRMALEDALSDKKAANAKRDADNLIRFNEEAASKELQAQIDAAGKADKLEQDRAAADQRHADRVQNIVQEYKKLNDAYSDPKAKAAIDARRDALIQTSESIRTLGLTSAEENQRMSVQSKEHLADLKQELTANRAISEEEKQSIDRRIANAKKRQEEDSNNLKTRFANHTLLLSGLESVEIQAAAKYSALEQQKTAMTEREVRDRISAIRRETAAAVGAKIDEVTQFENLERSKNAAYGRTVSNVFMIQQAFEDFQYAGIRGAANNIAMIASNIGGSGGIIALTAIMGIQLASSLGAFEKMQEAAGGLLGKTKEQLEVEKDLYSLRKQIRDNEADSKVALSNYNPLSDTAQKLKIEVAEEKNKLAVQRELVIEAQNVVNKYEKMKELAKDIQPIGNMPGQWNIDLGLMGETPEDIIKQDETVINELHRMKNDPDLQHPIYQQSIDKSIAAYKEILRLGQEIDRTSYDPTEAGYVEAKKQLEEYNKTLMDVVASLKELDEKQRRVGEFSGLGDRLRQLSEMDLHAPSAGGSFGKIQTAVEKANDQADKRATLQISQEIELLMKDSTKTEAEKLALAKEYVDTLEHVKNGYKELNADVAIGVDYANDTQNKLKENLSTLEKQITATETLIRADEKHLDTINKKISALEDEFGAAAVDRAGKLAEVKEKDANEAARKEHAANKQKLDDMQKFDNNALEQRAKYLKNLRSRDKSHDQTVDAEKNRFKQEMDRFYTEQDRANDKQLEEKLKANSRKTDLAKKAQLQEYADKQKDKLGGLQGKAGDLSFEGKFGEAMQVREQIDKLLKEMLQATDNTIKNGNTKEAEKAIEEAKKLEQAILQNVQDQAQLDQMRIDANQKIYADQMELLKSQKKELEEMSKITSINPGNLAILDGIINRLDVAKAKMLEMQSIQFVGSGTGGPAPRGLSGIGVGVGAGGAPGIAPQAPAAGPGPRAMLAPNVIHNNFSANMSQASPSAVFSAMAAAAQISAIRRA